MRLGDLDDLKVHISELMLVYSGTELDNAILNAIDNAPTVDLKDIYQEGHYDGHLEGYTKAINEGRPQGEWIIIKDERYGDNVKCPFCGKELAGTDLNFCCKCGAEMGNNNA